MRLYRRPARRFLLGLFDTLYSSSPLVLAHAASSSTLFGKKRFEVLYEDEAMVAIHKPAGIPTQGGKGVDAKMSIDAIFSEYKLVHRLDKDVSGALVMAKTAYAAKELGGLFQSSNSNTSHMVEKVYWAMVCGTPGDGIVDLPLKGKRAVTRVEVLQERAVDAFSSLAWLRLIPETGRMHQLRIHCADSLGAAILGDTKYGRMRDSPQKDILAQVKERLMQEHHTVRSWPRIFLHCREIRLPFLKEQKRHGTMKRRNDMFVKIVAPVPDHFTILGDMYGFTYT